MKGIALAAMVAVIVLASGCTEIPFIGGLFGPATVSYQNDIVVIRSLEATPNTVFPGQTVRLTAYVQNLGKTKLDDVYISLYDFCEGTFELAGSKVSCGINANPSGNGCQVTTLYPLETRTITWSLVANNDIKLQTTCPADGLKVSVNYKVSSSGPSSGLGTGLTTIELVGEDEMQRQMADGSYKEKQSYVVAGEGPIKGYIKVEDKQPVMVQNAQSSIGGVGTTGASTVISFQLKNEGSGFLATPYSSATGTPSAGSSPKVGVKLVMPSDMEILPEGNPDCESLKSGNLLQGLIQKESPKTVCKVKINGQVDKETSRTMSFSLEYGYEFRASTKVTVKPKTL